MIPKKLHYIWLSNEPINRNTQTCIESWKQFAQGYEIKRWRLADFDLNGLPVFVKEAISVGKWAFACDYLRLLVLHREGGIYLDSDVLMLKELSGYFTDSFVSSVEYIDDLFQKNRDLVDENGHARAPLVPGMAIQAAVMGSEAGHPFLKRCMEFYHQNHFLLENGELNNKLLAPHLFALWAREYGFRYINREQQLTEGIHLYPSTLFACNVADFSPESVMVHMCAGSWRKLTGEQRAYYQQETSLLIDYLQGKSHGK